MDRGMEKFEFVHFRWTHIGPTAGATVVICKDEEFVRKRVKYATATNRLTASLEFVGNRNTKGIVENRCVMSVGLCSPSEKNFSRRKGRRSAVRRMCNENPRDSFCVTGETLYEEDGDNYWYTHMQLARAALVRFYKAQIAPRWFQSNFILADDELIPVLGEP